MKKLLLLLLLGISYAGLAQTPGQIYDNAANNTTNPMDPDGDGYISASGAAWTIAETTELTFSAIPQVDPEPDGDIRTGSSCGATDVVDNPSTGAESSFVYFDDVNQIMVYRIRLAQDASGAFGYSVLVDTDGAFGFTGSSPDNNAVTGNPGFEFEIRYVTGATNLLYVDDVDGNNGSNGTDFSYGLDDNTQRAYALFNDSDCTGNDAVFYDFYIPLSAMGLTESSVIRLAAATSSNPSNSILSNPSDIAGIDDDNWPDEDLAYIELIGLQGDGTPVGNLGNGGCFLSGTSDTPTVFYPIFDSNSRVNGSSTEPEGAFITVFTNGDTLGTTTTVDANGFWSVSFTQGDLRPFDEITAVARDSCEYESAHSTKVNAINDLDSDNDGILDSQEGNGVDPGGDEDGDDIANYEDTTYPGFVDSNMDGINDNFDLDLDGIPNHFDPDANGDGLPDIYGAGGGAYDTSPVDGIIDEMLDSDGDGIPDIVDVDATMGTDNDFDGIDDAYDVTYTMGTDADGDGIDDATDPDDDNDGLYEGLDTDESGTPLTVKDTDEDGYLDYLDFDADGDGIPNSTEGSADNDGDGIPNHQDIDSDGDGILDNVEAFLASAYVAPSGNDTDGDGLDDAYDTDNGGTDLSSPQNTDGTGDPDYLDTDSDDDGVPDSIEGNDNNLNGVADTTPSGTDTDGDGLDDAFDTDNGGTPVVTLDSDGDGIDDYQDTNDDGDLDLTSAEDDNTNLDWSDDFTDGGGVVPDYLFNPDFDGDGVVDTLDPDSDNDGIPDADEDAGTGYDPTGDIDSDGIPNYLDPVDGSATGGYPAYVDSNNDGISDAFDTDLDGVPDFKDADSDGDGIVDLVEAGGTDSDGDGQIDTFTDTDGDGLHDAYDDYDSGSGGGEVTSGTPLTIPDSDGDGVDDMIDTDSDNDGISDNRESQATYTAPSGVDSNRNGLDDAYEGGSAIVPVDSDSDATEDYLDDDSDNDGVPDIVEGHDADRNGYGDWDDDQDTNQDEADLSSDTDGDGLLDAFDTDNGGTGAVIGDTDGDGIPDYRDTDDDGDGIDTGMEDDGGGVYTNDDYFVYTQGGGKSSPSNTGTPDYLYNPDADGDGVADANDPDSDNDGIPDIDENGGVVDILGAGSGEQLSPADDRDGDGIPNYLDLNDNNFTATDSNGDGIVDEFDSDLDGIPDFRDRDSDNDGVPDLVEAGGTDADNDGQIDSFTDADGDGLHDAYDDYDSGSGGGEVTNGTPLTNADTDGDGVADAFDLDSDNDGIPDIIENGGTDADGDGRADSNADTDRDGIPDIFDTGSGNAPLSMVDTDGDGYPDVRDRDSDGDGIADVEEAGGTDTNNDGVIDSFTDTDGDGLANSLDPDNGGSALSNPDTDGDGINDNKDLDSDGDGITDNVEAQTTAGYIAPNGASDANGFDTAYSGAGLDPEDTDNDGTPDFQDTDTDNDGILDRIEGNDANGDGVADTTPSGVDTDGDGLDDTFDTDCAPCGGVTGAALNPQNTDAGVAAPLTADSDPDYRDTDDDGDGIATLDEPLDLNPVNGIPNYLESSIGSCGTGFVTTNFNGNADAVFSNSGVTDFNEALGGNDGVGATFDLGEFFILDLTDVIPQGNSLTVRFRSTTNNRDINLRITSSLTSGGTYGNQQDYFTSSNAFGTSPYVVSTSGGIRYLRVEMTTQEHMNGDGELDAIVYGFVQCDADQDNDGTADASDNDDDNDGIPDTTEMPAVFLADDDADGTLNFEDADYAGALDGDGDMIPNSVDFDVVGGTDTDGDGIEDFADVDQTGGYDHDGDGIDNNFDLDFADFDGDGLANHLDLDSDSDGIPDAVEANDGTLPANMNNQGRYTVSYVQANDFDMDGHANPVDTDDLGTALPTTDTDLDGHPDFLDIDSDNDGNGDFIEGFDDNEDGDSLADLLARASTFESNNGNPGYYDNSDDNNGVTDGDGIPDWLEDSDSDGVPNFLDPDNVAYRDSDGDGLIDLFDSSDGGSPYSAPDGDGNGIPDYLQSGVQVTLPVELIYFKASAHEGTVTLTWETASELNNDYFSVERSSDAENFESIATIKGAGTTNEILFYSHLDRNPILGVSYYRLRQTDFDGAYSYSDIVVVTNASEQAFGFSLYPNPTTHLLKVELDGTLNSGVVGVRVISLTGAEIVKRSFSDEQIWLDVQQLPVGVYILETTVGDVIWKTRFIKK